MEKQQIKKRPLISAFSVYSLSSNKPKRGKKDPIKSSSVSDIKQKASSSKENLNKSEIKKRSFIRNLSGNAAISFKRHSIKKRKKTKELIEQLASEPVSSIELSTSQSLIGCDEALKSEAKKKQVLKANSAINLNSSHDNAFSGSPKKTSSDSDQVHLQSKSETTVAKNTENKQQEKKGVTQTKRNTSYTTVSKKASSIPKMPFPEGDSERDGKILFEWLIHPYLSKNFFANIWEKKPLLVLRHIKDYAEGLFSSEELNRILKENNVRYDVNLDITTYTNGVRETHNIDGRAFPNVVWDYYNNGCSVRLKNPQSFSKPVWRLCSTLQEYFKSMVGANVYLTPPGTQGFAPHYDDIEAFVLQLEGKKHWTLYNPRSEDETLPRYSSKNFDQSEIGDEIFRTTLGPGDLLYFPRGFIHQARSLPDEHSLHITISTYQKNSWADFMEELVPAALNKAIAEDLDFRKGLPIDYLTNLGIQNSDKDTARRREILEQVATMMRRLADYVDADAAADARGVSFLHDALPPVLNDGEQRRCVIGADVHVTSSGKPSACLCEINLSTKIRVMRKNALRLCASANDGSDENLVVRVHHSLHNSRVYHEEEEKFFELPVEFAPSVELLIHSYPSYVSVKELPLESDKEKINLAISLFEKGVLFTEKPIKMVDSI